MNEVNKMNKDNYLTGMDGGTMFLYTCAVHYLKSLDPTETQLVPTGLIKAVLEAEKGNYEPLNGQREELNSIYSKLED